MSQAPDDPPTQPQPQQATSDPHRQPVTESAGAPAPGVLYQLRRPFHAVRFMGTDFSRHEVLSFTSDRVQWKDNPEEGGYLFQESVWNARLMGLKRISFGVGDYIHEQGGELGATKAAVFEAAYEVVN